MRHAEQIRQVFDHTFYLTTYPDVAAACVDPLSHFLAFGMDEGRSPHCLFDPEFYRSQMPASDAGTAPFLHYLQHGDIDPHPLFDTAFYLAQAGGGIPEAEPPLLHFLAAGSRAASPNPLFDALYYCRANGLHDSAPRHPLLHYIESGWRDGCRTHPLFDPAFYLSLRPDVAQAGLDPLAHYLRHGYRETASTHELFDDACYRAQFRDRPEEAEMIDCRGVILHYAHSARASEASGWDWNPPSPHPLFDRAFYAARHMPASTDTPNQDAFLHFLEEGLGADCDPHPLFDTGFYRRRHPDVASAGVPPFLHFTRHGAKEGRDPTPHFDAAAYLARHPEAASLRFGALSHYLASGACGNRPEV